MTEQDIMAESPCGRYWIGRDRESRAYVVYRVETTHSTADSGYALTDDGLSIARARMDYLACRPLKV
jgi:hypothetical protein